MSTNIPLTNDFGRTAHDYRTYRAGFPPSLFERLAALGIGLPGQAIVDLGTGTGTLARGFAQRGSHVTGVDIAAPLLAQARALDAQGGVMISYVVAPAEDTGLPDGAADVVTAGQCWHWFDQPRVARAARLLLRPDGRLVIAYFDWIPLRGNVVAATEALIVRHNPAWRLGGGAGVYGGYLRDLSEAGFTALETWSYDLDVPYTHAAWRGRVRASAGVGASLPPEQVQRFDHDLAELLAQQFPAETLSVHHRVWAVIGQAGAEF